MSAGDDAGEMTASAREALFHKTLASYRSGLAFLRRERNKKTRRKFALELLGCAFEIALRIAGSTKRIPKRKQWLADLDEIQNALIEFLLPVPPINRKQQSKAGSPRLP